jgi:glycogen debranching enzyme
MEETISILDGSTFLVSGKNGDIEAGHDQPHGLFFKDTRHLSRWNLTFNNAKLSVLSTDAVEYYHAQFFCVRPTGTIYKNPTISVVRRRFVGDGFVEDIVVINHGAEAEEINLRLQVGSDFADLFEVKDALRKKGQHYCHIRERQLTLGYRRENYIRETTIAASVNPTEINEDSLVFRFVLPGKAEWQVQLHVAPGTGETVHRPKFSSKEGAGLRHNLEKWMENAPTLTAYPDQVHELYIRSLVDIAAHSDPVLPHWIGMLALDGIPGRWGRTNVMAEHAGAPSFKQLYNRMMVQRGLLDEDKAA